MASHSVKRQSAAFGCFVVRRRVVVVVLLLFLAATKQPKAEDGIRIKFGSVIRHVNADPLTESYSQYDDTVSRRRPSTSFLHEKEICTTNPQHHDTVKRSDQVIQFIQTELRKKPRPRLFSLICFANADVL